ncbi:MAG: VOC family protein [Acetobacteraceae bacterium]
MAVKAKPDQYHAVTPYLIADGAAKVIDFAKTTFGAVETVRLAAPGGRIGHAELRIGDSTVMLADASSEHPAMPATLLVYVEDVDATYRRALSAGATSVRPVANQFYGDRSGGVRDRSGNVWHIATHVEDVPPAELARRAEEAMRGACA